MGGGTTYTCTVSANTLFSVRFERSQKSVPDPDRQRGPGSGTSVKAILYTKELYCITIITVRGILIHEVNNERNWFTTLSRLSKFASEYLRKVKKFAQPF